MMPVSGTASIDLQVPAVPPWSGFVFLPVSLTTQQTVVIGTLTRALFDGRERAGGQPTHQDARGMRRLSALADPAAGGG